MYNRMHDTNDGEKPALDDEQQPSQYTPRELASYPPQPQLQQPQFAYPPPQPQPICPINSQSTSNNTTVVLSQAQQQVVVEGPRNWSTGLCSCFDDCSGCKYKTIQ